MAAAWRRGTPCSPGRARPPIADEVEPGSDTWHSGPSPCAWVRSAGDTGGRRGRILLEGSMAPTGGERLLLFLCTDPHQGYSPVVGMEHLFRPSAHSSILMPPHLLLPNTPFSLKSSSPHVSVAHLYEEMGRGNGCEEAQR